MKSTIPVLKRANDSEDESEEIDDDAVCIQLEDSDQQILIRGRTPEEIITSLATSGVLELPNATICDSCKRATAYNVLHAIPQSGETKPSTTSRKR